MSIWIRGPISKLYRHASTRFQCLFSQVETTGFVFHFLPAPTVITTVITFGKTKHIHHTTNFPPIFLTYRTYHGINCVRAGLSYHFMWVLIVVNFCGTHACNSVVLVPYIHTYYTRHETRSSILMLTIIFCLHISLSCRVLVLTSCFERKTGVYRRRRKKVITLKRISFYFFFFI